MCDDVQLCNRYVREFLILTRTWFAFGLPSKTRCDNVGVILIILDLLMCQKKTTSISPFISYHIVDVSYVLYCKSGKVVASHVGPKQKMARLVFGY
jgi:hypothetical protein